MRRGGRLSLLLCCIFAAFLVRGSVVGSSSPFRVRFDIGDSSFNGSFVIKAHPEWAPAGTRRFRELVSAGFYDNTRFFRVRPHFMVPCWTCGPNIAYVTQGEHCCCQVQFGLSGNPEVSKEWLTKQIKDEPVKQVAAVSLMPESLTLGCNAEQ